MIVATLKLGIRNFSKILGLPFVGIGGGGFDGVFEGVGEGGEEVVMGDAFEFVYGMVVEVAFFVAVGVADDEAEGLGFGTKAEDGFEEGFGNGDLVCSDKFVLSVEVEGSADDVDFSIAFCPVAAVIFDAVPESVVEVDVLRTDIYVAECLIHGLAVPFVVAGRAHMTARPSAAFVVGRCGSWFRHFFVFMKVVSAPQGSVGMVGSETPSHPVGAAGVFVVRGYIGFSDDELLGVSTFIFWLKERTNSIRQRFIGLLKLRLPWFRSADDGNVAFMFFPLYLPFFRGGSLILTIFFMRTTAAASKE